jgi:diguanylate cyclase (GGDEF)-like protein/PAS domain S-box-containing protein
VSILAAYIYWIIVLLWAGVLVVAGRAYYKNPKLFGAVRILLLVVAVDTCRNIFENIYFGLYFGAKYGVLPEAIGGVLGRPELLVIPKIVNVFAAGFVLVLLLLRWLPMALEERRRSERLVKEKSEELACEIEEHRKLFEASADLIIVTDSDRTIKRISNSSIQILGYDPSELIGRYGGVLVAPSELQAAKLIMQRCAATGHPESFHTKVVRKDQRSISVNWTAVWSKPAGRFFLIGRDMTETLAAQARLRQLALYDQLTGLPNRTSLISDLESLAASDSWKNSSIAIFDLDGFKEVNDAFGHAAGDLVLKEVAQRATDLSVGDVYRLGGDEFVIVFRDCSDPLRALNALDKLGASCDDITVEGGRTYLGVSAGVCAVSQAGGDVDELIYCADLALFEAKKNGGRASNVFVPTMRSAARARQETDIEIRRAAATQEFVLYYQPQIRVADGKIVGAEALLRWKHPDKGILAPGAFIAVLGQSTCASDVGDWIIRQACEQAASWQAQGLGQLRIGVNLFPCQFQDGSLFSSVAAALKASGLSPSALELEITENIALTSDDRTLEILQDLRKIGVGLSFDDFGTGYASLTHLTKFPLSRLKIDRSFVQSVERESPESGTIVSSMIAMAHELGLEVVAEGVETDAQKAFLMRSGCDEVQGYLYGKPMPADQFIRFIQESNTFPDEADGRTSDKKEQLTSVYR